MLQLVQGYSRPQAAPNFVRAFFPTGSGYSPGMVFRSVVNRLILCGLSLAFVVFNASCRKGHDEAKKFRPRETELNLPGVTAEEKKTKDALLDWWMERTYDAYDKIGARDKKWDSAAHEVLVIFSQSRAYGYQVAGYPDRLGLYARRAVELGCEDPLIRFLFLEYGTNFTHQTRAEVASTFAYAADSLYSTDYHPLLKFYVCTSTDSLYHNLKPFDSRATKYIQWITDIYRDLLADKKMPIEELDNAGLAFEKAIDHWTDAKDRYDVVEGALEQYWPNAGFNYVVRANFYVDWAWRGRSSKAASKVKPEQWEMFKTRLATAEEIVLKGIQAAPKEGRLPALMIKIASGQQKGLPEMRQWWEKSMEANTNNFAACESLMHFLQPQWFGSREKMIEFGRECARSEKFGGTVPLMLSEAHYMFNRNNGPSDGSYWLQEDVWPDIKESFDVFFKRNPKAVSWRHNYTLYAWWCEQWDVVNEQLPLLGEVNYSYFGGEESFNEMVATAKKHQTETKN